MTTGVNFNPAQTGFSRVFIIEGRARPDHAIVYQANLKAGGVSQSFGDVTKIEVPSPDEFGKFIEVGTIRGAVERATVTLTGRYAADFKSEMLRMARKGCPVDVHIILGTCTDPQDPTTYTKKIILENAFLTSYETEDIGALGSDEQAKVDESAEVSARDVYEIVPASWAEKGGDVVTNELVAIARCDNASCGDCQDESDGCDRFYAVSLAAGGSPSTPPDVVFTLDGGSTFYARDIDTMTSGEDPTDIGCVGSYVVVTSNDTNTVHIALQSEFTATTVPTWSEVSTGFVTGGEPNAIWSVGNTAFIVGDGGYIYMMTDATAGVTVVDAGVANADDYNAVHALSDEIALAGGNAGSLAITKNGTIWTSVSGPVGVGVNINAVWMKSEDVWFVGTSDGNLYYTLNGGTTWTLKAFPGSGSGVVEAIYFANDSAGVISHQTATTSGRLLLTDTGGNKWAVAPLDSTTLPANDSINDVVMCPDNPDIVIGVGLADNATDGFIVVGSD